MLQPARRKYRKEQKGRNRGVATRGAKVSFGEYGLQAQGAAWIDSRHIESARRALHGIGFALQGFPERFSHAPITIHEQNLRL